MKKRNFKRSLRVQRLEDRRLLAADLSFADCIPVEVTDTVMCQVAQPEVQTDLLEFDNEETPANPIDGDTTSLQPEVDVDTGVDPDAGVEPETDVEPVAEVEVETDVEVETEVEPETDVEPETELETMIHDLGDPVDGTDGFFGSIDADNPNQSFKISPSEAGMIDIVVASSFGDSETHLEVTDSNGDIVEATMTEEVSGFQVISFEAEASEAYQLDVSSEEGAQGYFQVTASHSEIPEPADLHVDTIGEESTQLEFVDGAVGVAGDLELADDVDTFRFTADSGGKVSLGLAELNAENATELQVQVLDSAGNAITRGITNETVGISFDVESGEEYFLAISAGEGQTGSYQIDMSLEADVVEPVVDPVVDQHVDEIGEDATELTFVDDVASIAGDLETADDADAFQFVAPGNGGVALDLTATSEEDAADISVAVFESNSTSSTGDPVVAGITNEDVRIVFDVVEGESFQVLVDALNDVPASYELSLSFTQADFSDDIGPIDDVDPADDQPVVDLVEDSSEVTDVVEVDLVEVDLAEDDMDVCFTDGEGEVAVVDSIFADFNLDSNFTIEGAFELLKG